MDQHPFPLLSDPFSTHHRDLRCHLANGVRRLCIQLKIQRGRKADRAQQTQLVFAKSFERVTDGADDLPL